MGVLRHMGTVGVQVVLLACRGSSRACGGQPGTACHAFATVPYDPCRTHESVTGTPVHRAGVFDALAVPGMTSQCVKMGPAPDGGEPAWEVACYARFTCAKRISFWCSAIA